MLMHIKENILDALRAFEPGMCVSGPGRDSCDDATDAGTSPRNLFKLPGGSSFFPDIPLVTVLGLMG